MYIDIHRHSAYPGNADIVLRNIFHFTTDQAENEKYCSVGLHPWHIKEKDIYTDIDKVKAIAHKENVLAIGETGLDKSKESNFDIQQEVFNEHLMLAQKHEKPMVIHCVRCYSEMSQIRRDCKHQQPWIFHWFNASTQMGLDLISKNCYLSFGHMLFFETSKAYKAFPDLPLENIFFETDDSEWEIDQVYEKAAELRGIELSALQKQIKANFERVFNIAL